MESSRHRQSNRRRRGKLAAKFSGGIVFFSVVVIVARTTCFSQVMFVAATPTECSRLAPFFLAVDQRIALCKNARTSAPADCARKAHESPDGLTDFFVLELCTGVTTLGPAKCVASLSRAVTKTLSPELRVELCKNARSDAPARCMEQLPRSKRHAPLVVDVCKEALSIAPADCLGLLPRATPDEVAVRLCSRAKTAGPAICTGFRGLLIQYGWDLAARLCQDARGQGPAECFHRTSLVTKLSTDDRIELCIDATNDAPARCIGDIRDQHLSSNERVALCRGSSSTAPAQCVAHVPPTVGTGHRVALCQGASEQHSLAPALCLKKILQYVPSSFGAPLCQGVSDSSAAECANVARHVIKDHFVLLALCRGASSTLPAECAKAAIRVGAEQHLVADLCAHTTSTAPASCFSAAPNQISADLRTKTCANALSVAPALCLAAAMPRGIRVESNEGGLCPLDPEAGDPPRSGLEHNLASRLCKHATGDAPAECGRVAPRQMSEEDIEMLCSAAGTPSMPGTIQCATSAILTGLSGSDAASVCRGAGSDAPALCAAVVAHRIWSSALVDTCVGATNDAPARCVNSLPVMRTPTPDEIAVCRATRPRPSDLQIINLAHNGEILFPNQLMQATLEVRDQWGGNMAFESSSTVRASIALRGSNGASVNAHGRFNTTKDGVVHFSHLSFSGAGNLTLQFFIDGYDSMSAPLASARVIVAETEHTAFLRRCGRLFSSLACPLSAARYGEECAAPEEHVSSAVTEAVAIVFSGAVTAWDVLNCQTILAENGVQTTMVSGRSYSLTAWIWYHPGMEELETGIGLPTREQSAWETLGVERNASGREMRRAYYRLSLLWHPDRWVRHSMHSARAQDVFEIVSEAYSWMFRDTQTDRHTVLSVELEPDSPDE